MTSLFYLTIAELHSLLKKGKITSAEITQSVFKRIKNVEPRVKSFITLREEEALKEANLIDRKIADKQSLSCLAGIPVAVKDSFSTKGIKTTAGSKILENYTSPYDATVVKKLKEAGAIIIGKTNLDEFSLGFTTETSAFGPTNNPWDLTRVPGGSSGGSAAAVAAGETIFAIGSEHYDSIRQPAAWCGVVGFKPTYGRVSRYGIVAMASSLECPGPITGTVEDAATVLDIIGGYDEHDANSLKRKPPFFQKNLNSSISGLKIGLADEYFSSAVEPPVLETTEKAVKVLRSAGARFLKIKLPSIKTTSPIFEVLYRAEVASNLARYDGIRYGGETRDKFGPLLKYQILTDLRAISGGEFEPLYRDALRLRAMVSEEFAAIFGKVDLLVSPMSPSLPFKKGFYRDGKYHGTKETDRFRSIVDIIAQLPALCGLPGISVPCGFSKGLPIGLQLYGPLFGEQKILNAAYAYEKETEWYKIKPSL
ncbi:MAG: amidase [bacterium]|nr:amidase [bacterium]